MRISKKFVGSNYNGKQVYVRRKNTLGNDAVRARRVKLQELERKFLAKVQPMSNSSDGMAGGGVGGGAGLMAGPGGMDAAALMASRSNNNKAANAGRALLGVGGGSMMKDPRMGGDNLGGFSSAQLAAELEKRSQGADSMQSRTSVNDFLGSASALQAGANVDALLANPFQSAGSSRNNLFSSSSSRSNLLGGHGSSNLLNAALSNSNLLSAARNSFHKNSRSDLSNIASFARKASAGSLLNANASFKKQSTSNLLKALASSGRLKGSTSNLLAARAKGSSAGLGLQGLLEARNRGSSAARHSGASLSNLLERHNSVDFASRVNNLMSGAKASKNWSAGAGGSSARLGSLGAGSRSNLANLRMSMQNEGGGSSIFGGNATFGGARSKSVNKETRKLELAKTLIEAGVDAESAVIAAGKTLEKEEQAELEKEVMMQQLNSASGFDDGPSPIGEYLLKQQMAGNNGDHADADEAEFRHMMELKRKFLSQSQDADGSEPAFKRPAR